jgi:methylglutaconyl-CoA hydratase
VQGAAFGGGLGLIACCDLAVAQINAKFCFSEVKLGLTPATISPYVIAKIGPSAARRFFVSAELFDAQAALTVGLLTEVVAQQQLDQRVQYWVRLLLANSPEAMAAAKRLVHDYAGQPITAAIIADSSQRIAAARTSSEGREGMNAFFEQRPAKWQVRE